MEKEIGAEERKYGRDDQEKKINGRLRWHGTGSKNLN